MYIMFALLMHIIILCSLILSFLTKSVAFTLQDIQEAHAGQIVAVFGVDCASGNVFD